METAVESAVKNMSLLQFTSFIENLKMDREEFSDHLDGAARFEKFKRQIKVFGIPDSDVKHALDILRLGGVAKTIGDQEAPKISAFPSGSSVKQTLENFSNVIVTMHTKIESLSQKGVVLQLETVNQ